MFMYFRPTVRSNHLYFLNLLGAKPDKMEFDCGMRAKSKILLPLSANSYRHYKILHRVRWQKELSRMIPRELLEEFG